MMINYFSQKRSDSRSRWRHMFVSYTTARVFSVLAEVRSFGACSAGPPFLKHGWDILRVHMHTCSSNACFCSSAPDGTRHNTTTFALEPKSSTKACDSCKADPHTLNVALFPRFSYLNQVATTPAKVETNFKVWPHASWMLKHVRNVALSVRLVLFNCWQPVNKCPE